MRLALLIIFIVFILMQFIRPEKVKYQQDITLEIQAPSEIKNILNKACYDCHSNKIKYPWYSDIAPFSWVVIRHTNEGVRALNFSIWESYNEVQKKDRLKAIYRTVYAAMPLPAYTLVHIEAKLTKEERNQIRDWTGVRK